MSKRFILNALLVCAYLLVVTVDIRLFIAIVLAACASAMREEEEEDD